MKRTLILIALLLIAAAPGLPTPDPYPGPTSYPGPATNTPAPSSTPATTATPAPTPVPGGTPVCEDCEPTAVSVTLMEAKTEVRPPVWIIAAAFLVAACVFRFRTNHQ